LDGVSSGGAAVKQTVIEDTISLDGSSRTRALFSAIGVQRACVGHANVG
jgi:hypothetical protein